MDQRVSTIGKNRYDIVCRDRHGNIKWRDAIHNLITTEGLNDVLTKYLKGSSYTAAWYLGLVDNTGYTAFAAGDTALKITTSANPPTTNGWQESEAYDEAVRQTLTFGTASGGSISNAASQAVFTISATATLKGAFVSSASGKHATTGVLYAVGAWSSGLTRSVEDGDTLSVTVTCTQASA